MQFTITSEQIIWLCSFIGGLWGLWKIAKEIRRPNDDIRAKLEQHDKFLDSDNKRLKEIEETNHLILQSLFEILNHNITGNGIEDMKKIRDSLQSFLVKR